MIDQEKSYEEALIAIGKLFEEATELQDEYDLAMKNLKTLKDKLESLYTTLTGEAIIATGGAPLIEDKEKADALIRYGEDLMAVAEKIRELADSI